MKSSTSLLNAVCLGRKIRINSHLKNCVVKVFRFMLYYFILHKDIDRESHNTRRAASRATWANIYSRRLCTSMHRTWSNIVVAVRKYGWSVVRISIDDKANEWTWLSRRSFNNRTQTWIATEMSFVISVAVLNGLVVVNFI